MRLGRSRRVRKRPEFQRIGREGRRISTPHFVLVVARAVPLHSHPTAPLNLSEGPIDPSEATTRLGITVTRKVGNAVRRNRLKRIIRAAFQETAAFLPPGFDLVVICKRDEPSLTSRDVVREWQAAASRIRQAAEALTRATQRPSSQPQRSPTKTSSSSPRAPRSPAGNSA